MGIYVFKKDVMIDLLNNKCKGGCPCGARVPRSTLAGMGGQARSCAQGALGVRLIRCPPA